MVGCMSKPEERMLAMAKRFGMYKKNLNLVRDMEDVAKSDGIDFFYWIISKKDSCLMFKAIEIEDQVIVYQNIQLYLKNNDSKERFCAYVGGEIVELDDSEVKRLITL